MPVYSQGEKITYTMTEITIGETAYHYQRKRFMYQFKDLVLMSMNHALLSKMSAEN